MSGTRTYQEASAAIQANLQKHLDRHKSTEDGNLSSDEDRDQSDDENGQMVSEDVMSKVFQSYNMDAETLSRTREAVIKSSSCLICISGVKKNDAIWNCKNCFCSFHVSCIQRWGKDCIFQLKNEAEANEDIRNNSSNNRVIQWGCPNCRQSYGQNEIPTSYFCYCEKVRDPPFDPWILPHSCGEKCGKELQPKCGHECLILCHPGPCPPCPKMVSSKCYCGNAPPASKRCFNKTWSCGRKCGRILNCGHHPCPQTCHGGECPPCQKTSVQLCLCQRQQKKCECATPKWQCEEKCGRRLECGHHQCDIVCHEGKCPPCPLSQVRRCPCGKSTHVLECTVATPTCGDTCGKTLSCGAHVCAERCHRGICGSCLQMVVKTCRCGNSKKEVACVKSYTCDVKCKRLRDCRKHACNRKCCDGSCPPCEQSCSKMLNCKNHKCVSRCHTGACYPCNQTKEVSCNCGASKLLVPCGREKTTKPPKCRQNCKNPPDCHHPSRIPHPCHFAQCPPCKQVCSLKMDCGHLCPVKCHDKVKVIKSGIKAAVPWETVSPRVEIQAVDCPDCQYPVPVTCLGGHETADWPCFAAKVGACGRKCGRKLACGNHTCNRDCHRVKNAPNDEDCGSNCRKCELECQQPRADGCTHPCTRPCHSDPCESCPQIIRIFCHCALTQLYVKCGNYTDKSNDSELLLCCQNQCPKIIACGHRCSKICHTGDCSDTDSCRKRTKIYCPCKRRKEEKLCGKVFNKENPGKQVKLQCDAECEKVKAQTMAEKEMEERKRKEEEERLQKEEVEKFEKKLEGKRKRRNRNRGQSETETPGLLSKYRYPIMIVTLLSVLIGFYILYY